MSEVNNPHYFLNQVTEQDFQDDVNALSGEVSNRALNLVTFHKKSIPFNRLDGRCDKLELILKVGGQQAATNTKKMVEEQLGTYLGASEDDWWFHSQGTESHIAEIFGEDRGYGSLEISEKTLIKLSHSPEYLQEEARRRESSSLQNTNREYTQVDIDVAMKEIGNINFPSSSDNQTYRYIHDLLFKIFNFHIGNDDCKIDIEALKEFIHDFHFFALQYHHDSYKEKSIDENKMFSEKLMHFLERVKEFGVE